MTKTKSPTALKPEAQAKMNGEEPRALAGVQIPVANIEPSATNPRKQFDQDELQKLAASIKKRGVLEPILVRPMYKGTRGQKLNHEEFWEPPGTTFIHLESMR